MNQTEINEQVLSVIRNAAETAAEKEDETNAETALSAPLPHLTMETRLVEELGLSSVEITVLLSDLEDIFHIHIPASALRHVRCAGDLCRIVAERIQNKRK